MAGGFTVASDGTIALSGGGGLIISNIAPLINGTLQIGNQTVNAKTNWTNDGTVSLGQHGFIVVRNNLTNNSDGILVGSGSLLEPRRQSGDDLDDQWHAFLRQQYRPGRDDDHRRQQHHQFAGGSGALDKFRHDQPDVRAAGAGNNAVLNLGNVGNHEQITARSPGGGVIQNSAQVVNLPCGRHSRHEYGC